MGRYGIDITNTLLGTLYRVYFGSEIQYDYDNIASSGKRQIIHSESQDGRVKFFLEDTQMSNHSYENAIPCNHYLEIFASYHETEGTGYKPCSAKLYSFKIYELGRLVCDFVPCYRKSDNVIGLYDLVEDKFYTNQGTGTFLKGVNADISPDDPVEVTSVGEYDEETGKYKIPIKANSEDGESVTTYIYLDEPLRAIGDYRDYIDFENRKIVRHTEETPIEEDIKLPTLPTFKGNTTYTIGTTLQPTEMSVTYYSNTKGE